MGTSTVHSYDRSKALHLRSFHDVESAIGTEAGTTLVEAVMNTRLGR